MFLFIFLEFKIPNNFIRIFFYNYNIKRNILLTYFSNKIINIHLEIFLKYQLINYGRLYLINIVYMRFVI